jgi:hypothetical protein
MFTAVAIGAGFSRGTWIGAADPPEPPTRFRPALITTRAKSRTSDMRSDRLGERLLIVRTIFYV